MNRGSEAVSVTGGVELRASAANINTTLLSLALLQASRRWPYSRGLTPRRPESARMFADVQVLDEGHLTSLVMLAWETARIQRSGEAILKAEERVNGIKPAIQRTEHGLMQCAYEKLLTKTQISGVTCLSSSGRRGGLHTARLPTSRGWRSIARRRHL